MKRALVIALLLAAATPALAQDPKSIIEQGLAQWIAAYNKGDAAALTAQYTSDATLMPQGSPKLIVGSAAIRSYFDGSLKEPLSKLSIPLGDAKLIDAKTIWAAGTWSAEVPGQNGAPNTPVGGTWMTLSKLDGNDWKLSGNTWNMMPPPAPAKIAMVEPTNNDQVKWGPAPPIIPSVVKLAVISGDPSQPGQPYTVRLLLPANFKVAPHYHPVDEAATVISGTFHLGMGDKIDTSKGVTLQPGGFAYAPAGMHHYGWTDGETVIQINGNGPFGLTYVNPEDDPTKEAAK
jgi:ketosteroid isomerase-like protein/mannose-6-phosphate isomerase-like protein (cupin superfamily)